MHRIALHNSARRAAFAVAPKVRFFSPPFSLSYIFFLFLIILRPSVRLLPAHMLLQSLVRPLSSRFATFVSVSNSFCYVI